MDGRNECRWKRWMWMTKIMRWEDNCVCERWEEKYDKGDVYIWRKWMQIKEMSRNTLMSVTERTNLKKIILKVKEKQFGKKICYIFKS